MRHPLTRSQALHPAEAPARENGGPSWLQRWCTTTADLAELQYAHPMFDAVIEEQHGRMIRVGDQWLADFASCNYLGLDLEPEVIDAIPGYLERWGTHPSWSRLLGSPRLYEDIEDRLTALLGAEDTMVLPTITHIHMSVIPILADTGTVFLDQRAHKTIYDGCSVARAHGATVRRFAHNDLCQLESLLLEDPKGPRVICIDGVNSMTGNAPDLAAFAALARAHDALLYVDDAHGFGVIGERAEDELCDYGKRGNSIVRHLGESYENVVLVGGFSKAYSSLLAFLALPSALKRVLKTAAAPYLYSGPSPVASLATVLEGMKINDRRGDELRLDVHRMTARVLDALAELGIRTPNASGLPIVEIPLANADDIDPIGRFLFHRGIYVTLAAYPLVPRDEVGFRIQVTAANTDAEVSHLIATLRELAGRFQIRADDLPAGADAPADERRRAATPTRRTLEPAVGAARIWAPAKSAGQRSSTAARAAGR
jgi:8-amino-7-oxononanoate synthase